MEFIKEKLEELVDISDINEEIKIYQDISEYCESKKNEFKSIEKDQEDELIQLEKEEFNLFVEEKDKALKELLQIYINKNDIELQLSINKELFENFKDKKILNIESDEETEKIKVMASYLNQIVNLYLDELKDYLNAEKYQKMLVDLSTKKPSDYIRWANIASSLGKKDEEKFIKRSTVELYEKLIDENKDNKNLVKGYKIKLLELLLSLKEYDSVEKYYLELIEEDPINTVMYYSGLVKFHSEIKKDYNKSIELYIKLIEIDKESEEKYLNKIVDLALEIENYELVLEKYTILESKFDKSKYKEKIAEFYFKNREYEKSIELYNELLELEPKLRFKYLDEIAKGSIEIKKYESAINIYKDLIFLNEPSKKYYQRSIVNIYWGFMQDADKTIETVEKFFGNDPEDKEIKDIYKKAQNTEKSIELDYKGEIGEHFEKTELEFKRKLNINMLLILNIVFLIIVFNKDIFFETKDERDNRIAKEEKKKKELVQKKKEKDKERKEIIKKAKEKFKAKEKKDNTKKAISKINSDNDCCIVINNIIKEKND